MSRYFARLAQRSEVAANAHPRNAQVRPSKGDPAFAEQTVEVISATADAIAGGTDAAPCPTAPAPPLPFVDGMQGPAAAVTQPQQAAMPSNLAPLVLRASAAASSANPATDRGALWTEAPDVNGSDAASSSASPRNAHAAQHPTDAAPVDPRSIDASTAARARSEPSAKEGPAGSPWARTTVARHSSGAAHVEPSARVARTNDAVVQVNIGRIELEISAPTQAQTPIPMHEAAPPPRPAPQRPAPFNPHRHYLRSG